MLRLSTMGSYYAVLGIRRDASLSEIRRAYRKLAMKWHPDRCKEGEAKQRFQQIQEAYQVLSDEGKRKLYDAGLYDPLDDEYEIVEGFADFVQEMRDLMSKEIRKEKEYSLEELQRMLAEMAQSFNSVPSFSPQYFSSGGSDPNRSSMGFPWEPNPMASRNTNVQMSSFGVFGSRTSYC